MEEKRSLDIVLPAYNPTEGWENVVIEEVAKIKQKLEGYAISVILVDDGSAAPLNATAENISNNIENFSFLQHVTNKGKGAALRTGIQAAQSQYIVFTDIDFPYSEDSFLSIVENLRQDDIDIAIGNRDSKYYQNIPTKRAKISALLKRLSKLFFKLPSYDTQCGLKGFKQSVKESFLKTQTNRFLVDLEFLKLVQKENKFKVRPIPVVLKPNIQLSEVRIGQLIKESGSFLKILLGS